MKKLKLFSLGLLGASLFLTSCGEDDPNDNEVGPSLTVTELNSADGIVDGTLDVTVGDEVKFQWDARKGSSDLDEFEISVDGMNISELTDKGNQLPFSINNANDETYIDSYTYTASNEGSRTFIFEVTDKNGLNKTESVTVSVSSDATPLASAENFQWIKCGGPDGTGLTQFGLKWENNSSQSAIILKNAVENKMVFLSNDDFTGPNAISTREELILAIQNGTAQAEYRGVSVTASNTYDDVIGVMNGTDYYLLRVNSATVEAGQACGTRVTIDGQYKN